MLKKKYLIPVLFFFLFTSSMYAQDAKQVIENYYKATGGYKWDKIKILAKEQTEDKKNIFVTYFNFPYEYRFESDIRNEKIGITIHTQKVTWSRQIFNKDTTNNFHTHTSDYPVEILPEVLMADTTLYWDYVGITKLKNQKLIEIKTTFRSIKQYSLFFDANSYLLTLRTTIFHISLRSN